MCQNNMFCIFNGRCYSDPEGKATTVLGTVVEYVVGAPLLLSRMKEFQVMDFNPLFSDKHNITELCIYGNNGRNKETCTEDDDVCTKSDNIAKNVDANEVRIGKWKEEEKMKFCENVQVEDINILV